jgi:TRAP-type uncharacterized transport system fused permease subunit
MLEQTFRTTDTFAFKDCLIENTQYFYCSETSFVVFRCSKMFFAFGLRLAFHPSPILGVNWLDWLCYLVGIFSTLYIMFRIQLF